MRGSSTAGSDSSAVSTRRWRGSISTEARPAGSSTSNVCAGALSSQMQGPLAARAVDDLHLDGLADGLAFAPDGDARRAPPPRRDAHRVEVVVHDREPVQPLPPEPVQVGAEQLGRRAPQRHPLDVKLARQRREARGPDEIEQLVVEQARTGARVGEAPHTVADLVAIVDVAEVGRRRREQRRVHQLVDRGHEVDRREQLAEVFDVAELGARVDVGQVGRQDARRAIAIDRRLVRADGGVRDRREDRARDLHAVVLAQAIEGEDAEDLVGHQDHVAVLLHQIVPQRRLDQRQRQVAREAGRVREQRATGAPSRAPGPRCPRARTASAGRCWTAGAAAGAGSARRGRRRSAWPGAARRR